MSSPHLSPLTPPSRTLAVRVWRGAETGEFVAYDVPRQASQTVLDVVTHIQRNIDPTLSYRFACRVGMCGSCAMNVNGKARWTCRTHVADVAVDDALEIAPLRNLPMVKDLVTDMAPFFDKMARAKSNFKGAATRADEFARVMPDSPQRKEVDAAIECMFRTANGRLTAAEALGHREFVLTRLYESA